MKELARQPWGWVLYESAAGRLVLSVHCGSVASYEISLELSEEDTRRFRNNGSPPVESLAREVMADPRKFGARNVKLQGEDVVSAPLTWHR
jgi:hypothetical protein